jgi:hypothetical protein
MVATRAACCSALLVLLASCGGDRSPEAAGTTAAPVAVPESEVLGAPNPTPQPPPTTSEPLVATTIPIGLPVTGLGIFDAASITLGSGSSVRSSITIRGVAVDDVRAWVLDELALLGYTVTDPAAVAFEGPGAAGTVTLTPRPPDLVVVVVALGARPA